MNKIIIVLVFFVGMLLGIMLWFAIPYSSLRKEFHDDVALEMKTIVSEQATFTESDFANFPNAIQSYIKNNGYLGTERKKVLCMSYKDVDFSQGLQGPQLQIDYTQYNFADKPDRLAFIDSRMFGIPFQGYDYFHDGIGGMKGVFAKSITLFNQTGKEMDKACLVTYLAECLFLPESLLSGYITFSQIDEYSVLAKITYNCISASGVFSFNSNYEMTSFVTQDRAMMESDGSCISMPWTAACGDYAVDSNGINRPRKFSAIWNYTDKDFVYFDGCINEIK